MKLWLLKLFSESNEVSEGRVQSMLITLTGIYSLYKGMQTSPIDYSGLAMLVGGIFTIAQGGKVLGKIAENKKVTVDKEEK